MSTVSLMPPLSHKRVLIISRCAWTLFNFRLGLVKSIAAAGAEVTTLGARDGYESRLVQQAVRFRHIPVALRGLSPLADLWLFVCLIREMRRTRPELVHCFTIKPAIYATIAAWLCRVPARIVTITGLGYSFTSAGTWVRRVVMTLYRVALARAHLVYFQNAADRDFFVRVGLVPARRAALCPGSGVNIDRFAPTPLPSSETGGAPQFLMIARLIREKGVLEFLAAAAAVKQRHPEATFCLLGGEDPRNPTALSAHEIEALRRSEAVTWLGETDDVRPHIARSDVVVLPSYREGLPRVLIEAGAMGRPAIATDCIGCRDVIADGVTGYLVRAQDAAALAEAMEAMIRSAGARRDMGVAARARIVANFDERAVISQTLSDYERLLSTRGTDADTAIAA